MAARTHSSRIVVKLGTSTLTAGTERISPPRLVELIRQIARLHTARQEVLLVSSGAIAAGREGLHHPRLPKDIPAKQMLAAVGQPRLMALYQQLFGIYGLTAAQVLLTRSDLADRRRYLNSRNTLDALLSHHVIPIINENDTVATEEIRLGDNDNLSALVANLIEADLLILLTDQAGLYTADPHLDPHAELVHEVTTPEIPAALWLAAGGAASGLGTGGMVTKLQAADLARRSGVTVVIARGSDSDVLLHIAAGKPVGTRFLPSGSLIESRKRYILAGGRAGGRLEVDEGAAQALLRGGSVSVFDLTGREVARGLANYSAADLPRILGHRSDEIEALLGFAYGDEVIHHNNMVLLQASSGG